MPKFNYMVGMCDRGGEEISGVGEIDADTMEDGVKTLIMKHFETYYDEDTLGCFLNDWGSVEDCGTYVYADDNGTWVYIGADANAVHRLYTLHNA